VKYPPRGGPIVIEGCFAAPPEKVFEAWTYPDMVVQWFCQALYSLKVATIDLRPGGAWQFLLADDGRGSMAFEGAYLEVRPPERLVFSWSHMVDRANGGRDATSKSRVEVDFTRNAEGTDVRLVHSAIQSTEARRSVGAAGTRGSALWSRCLAGTGGVTE
jgi:uncharacterized protein YndB with AHSA1/START domain